MPDFARRCLVRVRHVPCAVLERLPRDDAGASGAGACGISAQLACTAKGTKVVCR